LAHRHRPIAAPENAKGTPTMICPHCNKTIREEERYLMSVDPNAETLPWVKSLARYVVLFLVLVAVFALLSHASVI
jgi:hypothetical protein